MNSIKQAFNHSFEQVSFGKEPEFTIHGIGYQGKWGGHTMATFIKDLESVEEELKDDENETITTLKDEIASLKGEIEDLKKELDEQ